RAPTSTPFPYTTLFRSSACIRCQRIFCHMSTDYLKRILTARVYDAAIETDLDPAPQVSARIGNTVLLKREDSQPVFSFKVRGARSEEHTSELQSRENLV